MEHAIATEMPLALFTTLAPLSAGAFIALAIAFFTTEFSEKQQKLLDRLSLLVLGVLAAAFVAAFFHLTTPLHALSVFNGIGRSPLTNEIIAGIVFGVLLLVYCVVALAGKLGSARKYFAAVVALAGLVFAFFIGQAYAIPTILSWNTPLVPVSLVGFTLLGGALLGTMLIGAAGALEEARATGFKAAMLIVAVIGAAASIGGVWAHFSLVSGLSTAVASGALIAEPLMIYLAIATALAALALICELVALFKVNGAAAPALGVLLVAAAILIARLAFYAMQISVGI